MNDSIPKPWEAGFSIDKLPSEPRKHAPFKTDGCKNNAKNFGARAMKNLSPEDKAIAKAKELATRKENKKRLKRLGTRKVNAKHLRTAEQVLQDHNFDPLDLLMDVAQGKALYDDHPFLPILFKYLNDMAERLEYQDGFGVKGLLQQLRIESMGYLKDSYTPKEHRIKVASEILQYVRPKKKQVEHTNSGAASNVAITPLTQEEIESFDLWFNENF